MSNELTRANALLEEADALANQWVNSPDLVERNLLIYGYRAGYCYARNHPAGWISVKDRLPDGPDDKEWLCWFNYNKAGAQTTKRIREAGLHSCLTHWMPLPEPPKPEKSELEIEAEKYAESLSRTVDKQAAVKDFISGAQWARKVWRDV